jgi:Fic family protein
MLQSFMDGNHRTAWLLQNFILMDSGYPPLLIDDVNYNKYEQVKEETRKWGGLDIRPFIRCIYGCMEDTIRVSL